MNENLKKNIEIGQCPPKKLIDKGRNHRENCKIQTKMQTKYQNLQDIEKVLIMRKCVAINTYIKEKFKSAI